MDFATIGISAAVGFLVGLLIGFLVGRRRAFPTITINAPTCGAMGNVTVSGNVTPRDGVLMLKCFIYDSPTATPDAEPPAGAMPHNTLTTGGDYAFNPILAPMNENRIAVWAMMSCPSPAATRNYTCPPP